MALYKLKCSQRDAIPAVSMMLIWWRKQIIIFNSTKDSTHTRLRQVLEYKTGDSHVKSFCGGAGLSGKVQRCTATDWLAPWLFILKLEDVLNQIHSNTIVIYVCEY